MNAMRFAGLSLILVAAASCGLGNLPPGDAGTGNDAHGTGGGTAGSGAGGAGTGGTGGLAGTGGSTLGAGGAINGTGGASAGTGGASAGTGGTPAGSGGAGAVAGSDGGVDQGPTCAAGALCTPAAGADPCGVYATDCSSGASLCIRVGNALPGTLCSAGVCSAVGVCAACASGAACTPAGDPCKVGALDCSSGQPSCVAGTTPQSDGSPCGADRVCHAGVCGVCAANQACTPSAGACVQGLTSCTTGVRVCQATNPIPPGQSCGSNQVCSDTGSCVDCAQGLACTPANLCHTGALSCASGSPTCADTNQSLPDNVFCDVEKLCTAGSCVDAGSWITHGEDARTLTGGWVFTFQQSGATILPLSSTSAAFTPSPGGRTGSALAVSGSIPAQNPAQNVSPISALGWRFTNDNSSLNGGARGSGVQFYAKAQAATALIVSVLDIWTDPTFPNCSTSTAPDVVDNCYDYPQAICNLQPGSWTLCRFFWSDLKRPDWGSQGANMPVDPNAISAMQFNIAAPLAGSPAAPFQFAIDDASFIPTGSAPFCQTPDVIDDMEDGDGQPCPNPNWGGAWYVTKSASAGPTDPVASTVVLPWAIPNGGRAGSLKAMQFSGTALPANEWALIGLSLDDAGPYDASAHLGMTFWAMSPGGSAQLRVNFPMTDTIDVANGGSCVPTTVSCEDHRGWFVDLTPSWQLYTISFPTDLKQIGWGVQATQPDDLTDLWGIEFLYQRDPNLTPANPADFEYWIDDMTFYDN